MSLQREIVSIQHYVHRLDTQVYKIRPYTVSTVQVIPLACSIIYMLLYTQVNRKTFRCVFYEIPEATYDADGLPKEQFQLNAPDIMLHYGTLIVDFDPGLMQKGAFKTAHPGKVQLDGPTSSLPPFTDRNVCVKQVYERRRNSNAITRMDGRHELDALTVECNCVRWASIMLDLTYQFIAREIKTLGKPPYPIPVLRFTRVMIAIVQNYSKEKVFLVEEWIDTDGSDHPFIKYLGNQYLQPCVSDDAPPEAHNIAKFLTFAQHVQWEKSQFSAFTSDYQGAGKLLTDPQITSNPYVSRIWRFTVELILLFARNLGIVFGDGNLQSAWNGFRTNHVCNSYCKFFGLTLDVPCDIPTPSISP